MQNFIKLALAILCAFSIASHAEEVVNVYENCDQGIHEQPRGRFAIHVFCDSALGTNVAIFMNDLDAPLFGKYDLGRRFWQGEQWNYDVTSFSWLKDDQILLSTSHIYGSGAVYKLNVADQSFEILIGPKENICLTRIKSVNDNIAKVGLTDCDSLKETIVEIAL